jgi:hypothetical protein
VSNAVLTSITIPNSITNIGSGAFAFCPALTTINVIAPDVYYGSKGGVLFSQNLTTLIQCPGGFSGTYTVPTTVTNILTCAFNGCYGLTSFSAGNAYYSSSNGVLYNQNETTLVQFPSGLTAGGGSFSTLIASSVTSIGAGAFQDCIHVSGVLMGANITSIGSGAFAGSGLTAVNIPGSVTNIGSQAFAGCAGLASVTITNGVPAIGVGVFLQCPSLTSLVIPASVATLGDYAFASCVGLTNVYFIGSPPSADATDFAGDNNTTAYYFYEATGWSSPYAGLPALPWLPFGYATNAGGITITNYSGPAGVVLNLPTTLNGLSVSGIGTAAFATTGIRSVMIPYGITIIGTNAFAACSSLTNVVIADSVTTIGKNAFAYCSSLASITIPYSVSAIGDDAFSECSGLKNIYFMGNLPTADSTVLIGTSPTLYYLPGTGGISWGGAFGVTTELWTPYAWTTNSGSILFTGYSGPGNTGFIIPPTINGLPVTGIGPGAFAATTLTDVVIPASVTNLADDAFANGTNLTRLDFSGDPPAADDTVFAEIPAQRPIICMAPPAGVPAMREYPPCSGCPMVARPMRGASPSQVTPGRITGASPFPLFLMGCPSQASAAECLLILPARASTFLPA